MEFYPTLPADASPGAGGMDAPGVMPGSSRCGPLTCAVPGGAGSRRW